jgi:phosphoenolpyruvate synthase/pyruvate phosphate dikinase
LGLPAIVGTGKGTEILNAGQEVTVSCAEGDRGFVYEGIAEYEAKDVSLENIPTTQTQIMLNLANPAAALRWWRLPSAGVGLARMEFIINNLIKIHSMALVHWETLEDQDVRQAIAELTNKVLEVLVANGLSRGEKGLEIYVMCEIPSNVVLASQFAERFDGFSIGSNDLTQLVFGIERDSERLAELFDERNEAVTEMIATVIRAAHQAGRKIGICGQAPSDHPEFARFLVHAGIDSISVNPDSFITVKQHVADAEAEAG